jgi:hypothetical protein
METFWITARFECSESFDGIFLFPVLGICLLTRNITMYKVNYLDLCEYCSQSREFVLRAIRASKVFFYKVLVVQ